MIGGVNMLINLSLEEIHVIECYRKNSKIVGRIVFIDFSDNFIFRVWWCW